MLAEQYVPTLIFFSLLYFFFLNNIVFKILIRKSNDGLFLKKTNYELQYFVLQMQHFYWFYGASYMLHSKHFSHSMI